MVLVEGLSDRLQEYIADAQGRTGRQVDIHEVTDVGLPGMAAAFEFKARSPHLTVKVCHDDDAARLERPIAHEIGHGLLAYEKHYPWAEPTSAADYVERQSIRFLTVMMQDIIVNRNLMLAGFAPLGFKYPQTVTGELYCANEVAAGRTVEDPYQGFQEPALRDRFMVLRYITTWGYLRHIESGLGPDLARLLFAFIDAYKRAYPRQYALAAPIRDAIIQNDIFNARGYKTALTIALRAWTLDRLVRWEVARQPRVASRRRRARDQKARSQ